MGCSYHKFSVVSASLMKSLLKKDYYYKLLEQGPNIKPSLNGEYTV